MTDQNKRIIAYMKDCTVVYLGVLVGIVGSIDTRAPSGSTIIMAVFLQKTMKFIIIRLNV